MAQPTPFRGIWDFAFSVDVNTLSIQYEGNISIEWVTDTLSITGKTVFNDYEFDRQEFSSTLALGKLQLNSNLVFDASSTSFSKFEMLLSLQAWGISWSTKSHFASTLTEDYLEITGNKDFSWARWSLDVLMSICPATFSSAEIKVQDISFCTTSLDMDLLFSKQGFESIELNSNSFRLPDIPAATASLKLKIEPTQQELSADFLFTPPQGDQWLKLAWKLLSEGGVNPSITSIELTSIDAMFTMGNVKAHILHTAIWDLMELSGGFIVGENMTGDWRVQVYFQDQTGALFGFHKLLFDARMPLGANLKIETQINLSQTIKYKFILTGGFSL